ncbi:MAG: BON domain-containing protein [Nitrospiraceae bacterium]|nr:MAG: BON domain-containing protein [Nitrospiraceae bacterium]
MLTLQSYDCTYNKRRSEMKNSRSLSQKFILLTVVMVFGLALFSGCASMTGKTAGETIDDAKIVTESNAIIVKDQDAKFLKIDVSSTDGNVVLVGFINDKTSEDRIVAKIRQIRGVKSVQSNLKVEEKK